MKKILLATIVVASTLSANAQSDGPLAITVGISPSLPLEDFNTKYSIGGGAFGKIDYRFTDNFGLNVSISEDYFFGKTISSGLGVDIKYANLSVTPIMAGALFQQNRLFINANVGYSLVKYKDLDSKGYFTVSPRLGYYVTEDISIDLGYNLILDNNDNVSYLNSRIGYTF